MKYLAILGALVVISLLLTRQSPEAGVAQTVAEADAIPANPSAAPSPTPHAATALKQPIDRTRAALSQVKERNGDGEF